MAGGGSAQYNCSIFVAHMLTMLMYGIWTCINEYSHIPEWWQGWTLCNAMLIKAHDQVLNIIVEDKCTC